MTDARVIHFLRAYFAEVVETVPPVPGVDLEQYQNRLIQRFSNVHIRDQLARLAEDGSMKVRQSGRPAVHPPPCRCLEESEDVYVGVGLVCARVVWCVCFPGVHVCWCLSELCGGAVRLHEGEPRNASSLGRLSFSRERGRAVFSTISLNELQSMARWSQRARDRDWCVCALALSPASSDPTLSISHTHSCTTRCEGPSWTC